MPFMEISSQILLRLLLTFDNTPFKKFYWFEMRGNDFFWGSAYKSSRAEDAIIKIDGTNTTITVPNDFDKLPKL